MTHQAPPNMFSLIFVTDVLYIIGRGLVGQQVY